MQQEVQIVLTLSVDANMSKKDIEAFFYDMEQTYTRSVSSKNRWEIPSITLMDVKEEHEIYREREVLSYTLSTVMGRSNTPLPFLNAEQMTELNSIGYSGKRTNGDRMSKESYLNSLRLGQFKVSQVRFDNGDFSEEFLIIRVK